MILYLQAIIALPCVPSPYIALYMLCVKVASNCDLEPIAFSLPQHQ